MASSAHYRDLDAARIFLATVFDERVPGQVAISTRRRGARGPTTRFFDSISEAAGYACERAEKEDVYYRVTTLNREPRRGRGKDSDTLAVTNLHADIDLGSSDDIDRRYPPDEAAALYVLGQLGIPLPMLIRSGSGLHALWLLKEPLVLLTPQDLRFAKAALKGWHDHLNVLFGGSGWKIDPPGGLSKLLRPPGTLNHKTVNPRPVELLPGPIHRWASIECMFEDVGIDLTTASGLEARSNHHERPMSDAPLPPDVERRLLEDPIAGGLLRGSLLTRKSASEDDLWLLIRAGSLGIEVARHGLALIGKRRSATDKGWGTHAIPDYVRRTIAKVEETLRNPRQISGPGIGGRWAYRNDVIEKCWEARDWMLDDGLNLTAFMVLEEMCRWSKDGITTAVAQVEIQKRFGWKSRQPVHDAQQALRESGWLLLLAEAKRDQAASYVLLLDPAFHPDLAS